MLQLLAPFLCALRELGKTDQVSHARPERFCAYSGPFDGLPLD